MGELDKAEQVLREGTATGDPDARAGLAQLFERHDQPDKAEAVSWDGVAAGDFGCLPGLVAPLEARGREDATRLRRYGLNADGSFATSWWPEKVG